jgi:hypothetical protein
MSSNDKGVKPEVFRSYAMPSDTASIAQPARELVGEDADLLSDLESVRALQVPLTMEVAAATRVVGAALIVRDGCGIDSDDTRVGFKLDNGIEIILPPAKPASTVRRPESGAAEVTVDHGRGRKGGVLYR